MAAKPPVRVALYARFSTDLQRQTSISDQLIAARARAEIEGWPVVIEHGDEGVSGAVPVALRPGGKALLGDASSGRFEVLIVEGLDRLSRDMGEQDLVVKRLEYWGIRLIGTSDGYDSLAKGRKVMRVARGLVNELYLDDLRDKTHRGLAGQFTRGMSAGGRSYGYRSEIAPQGHRLVIDEAEAEHVRWIFDRFVEGWSPISIVHELNRRGIPSPRGKVWAISAVHGSAARGLGLLNNELYVGRVYWNRRQWLKEPDSGKRRYVERPPEEWQVREQQDLRIVDARTWELARERIAKKAARGQAVAQANKGGRPTRTLFGGLLRCANCGGPVVATDSRVYSCSIHKDRGPTACSSKLQVRRKDLDSRLLSVVQHELRRPDALLEFQTEVRTQLAAHSERNGKDSNDARQRLTQIQMEIDRLVDAIASVGGSTALMKRLQLLEKEAAELEKAALPVQTTTTPALDNIVARYQQMLLELQRRLESEKDRERTREILREMLGPITLVGDDTGAIYAEMKNPAEQLLAVGGVMPLTLVARAGFEPATFGL